MQDVDTYTITVAGASFRQNELSNVERGAACAAELDERNEYDENAIKLLVGGVHIGFVPRDCNRPLADLMRAGARVTGVVESVGRSKPTVPLGAIIQLTVDYSGVK